MTSADWGSVIWVFRSVESDEDDIAVRRLIKIGSPERIATPERAVAKRQISIYDI